MKSLSLTLILLVAVSVYGQGNMYTHEEFYARIMGKDSLVDKILRDREHYHLQLMCTTFDTAMPVFHMDATTNEYFFPASTVKLPMALATLEILNERGLQLDDYVKINPDLNCGNQRFVTLSQKNKLTFRTLIEEMMVVSDNDYYNILYHFVTPFRLNNKLNNHSYNDVHIFRAFTGCDSLEQLRTNSLDVFRGDKVIYHQDSTVMPSNLFFENYIYDLDLRIGSKHEASNGKIVEGPFDFNYNLVMPVRALHQMLIHLMHPELEQEELKWNLRDEDRLFLLMAMYEYPKDLKSKKYTDANKYPNNYMKYLYLGESTSGKERTASKIGLSYGFVTETVFIPIPDKGGMYITISMYTNANDTVNDGIYEYDELARPFLSRLGAVLLAEYGL